MNKKREEYTHPLFQITHFEPAGFLCLSGEGSIDGMNWGDDDVTGTVGDIIE